MPFGDGTGPTGVGPMTGRGAGFCAGYAVPGRDNFAPGRACRRPGARGWRNRYYATGLTGWQRTGAGWGQAGIFPPDPARTELELATLEAQAENLARTLEVMREQIRTLEAQEQKAPG